MKRTVELNPILSYKGTTKIFPSFVTGKQITTIGGVHYFYYRFLLGLIRFIFRYRLKAFGSSYKRHDTVPENKEEEKIYAREAKTYEHKHHLTTNYRDTWWRRQVVLEVMSYIRAHNKKSSTVNLLDIGTGIGLSMEEMFCVFKLFDIHVNAVGLDYNEKMLKEANSVILSRMKENSLLKKDVREIRFTRGDARNLTDGKDGSLEYFSKESFDVITIMFGIGGVDYPLEAIKEQLLVLKRDGILIVTDMHRPIIELSEKWPWFIGSKYGAAFSAMAWEHATKPLALAMLWGWRDPSLVFYLSPLLSHYDEDKRVYYGFEQVSLSLNNEFWWFNVPVVPTAKIVLKKIEISKE